MKKFNLAAIFIVLFNTLCFAQFEGGDDPPPPTHTGGGARTVPIDMYLIPLIIFAVITIIYLSKKKQIKNL